VSAFVVLIVKTLRRYGAPTDQAGRRQSGVLKSAWASAGNSTDRWVAMAAAPSGRYPSRTPAGHVRVFHQV